MKKFIDLSRVIENGMPIFPGDEATVITQSASIAQVGSNIFTLTSGMHAGTHIDTPLHFFDNKDFVSDCSLERFIGKAKIVDVRNRTQISYLQYFNELIHEGDIVLFYTGFDKFYGTPEYYTKHPVITQDLADFLIRRKVKLVGMDTPSPDYEPFPIHKTLLGNNIFIIENLCNLDKLIHYPAFELVALPLKTKTEASLARVVAIIED
jgi:kynurenine formamidase